MSNENTVQPQRLHKFAMENQQRILSSTRRSENQSNNGQADTENDPGGESLAPDPGEITVLHTGESFSEFRDSPADGYEETPLGSGRFSKIPETPDSNDQDGSTQSQIDELSQELEYFGSGLQDDEGWQDMINTEYDRLHKAITELQQECLLKVNIDAVAEVEQMFEILVDHRNNLSTRAHYLQHAEDTSQILTPARLVVSSDNLSDHPPPSGELDLDKEPDINSTLEALLAETVEARIGVLSAVDDASRTLGAPRTSLERPGDMLPKILDLYNKVASAGGVDQLSKQLEQSNEQLKKLSIMEQRYDLMYNQVEKVCRANMQLVKKIEEMQEQCKQSNQNVANAVTKISQENETRDKDIGHLKKFMTNVQTSLRALTRWVKSLIPGSNRNPQPGVDSSMSPILNRGTNPNHTPSGVVEPSAASRSCPSSPTRGIQTSHNPQSESNLGSRNGNSVSRRLSSSSENLFMFGSSHSATDTSLMQVHQSRLDRGVSELTALISTTIKDTLSDDEVVDLYTNVLDDVKRVAKECDEQCISYAKIPNHSLTRLRKVNNLTSKANTWATDVKKMYRKRQLHLHSSVNKAFTGSLNLKKFSATSSETVFEFFHKFDQFTRATYTSQQKAMLLYSTYLDEKLKMELVPMCNSYEDMKEWLVKKFGRVKGIIDSKLESIKTKKQPGIGASSSQRADYCRHVFSILASIQTLPVSSNIPMETVAVYAYSHESMLKVLQCLPSTLVELYMQKITKSGMDTDYFEGKDAFDILMTLVKSQYKNLEATAKVTKDSGVDRKASSKERGREKERKRSSSDNAMNPRIHNVSSTHSPPSRSPSPDRDQSPRSDREHTSVHYQSSKQASPSSKGKTRSGKWYDSKYRFPCPLSKHSHEIGTCTDFFKKEPKNRKWASYRKLCYCCLAPYDNCRDGCQNISKVPVKLVCQECLVKIDNRGKSPFNQLFCMNKEHSKLTVDDLAKECEQYFKGFTAEKMKSVMPATINLVAVTSKCKGCNHKHSECDCDSPFTYSSPTDPDSAVPFINTTTGDLVDVDSSCLKLESPEEAFYLMQTFDIRGQECLTFFDRGANQNLIDGDLAESANLKVLNPRSVPIGVVGGGRIWTEYGMYSLNVGPTPEGYYHEVKCQGIKKITESFPHYDLAVVNKSVRKSGELSPETKLPKFIGGSKVKLLLGIKDVQLDPVRLFTLPCGLGVYQSQLADKFQSRICFGGPHSLITEVNERAGGNFNHLNVYFTEMVQSYRTSLYPKISSTYGIDLEDDDELPLSRAACKPNVYAIMANKEVDITMNTTPLSLDDTKIFEPDTGFNPSDNDQFDEGVECTNEGKVTEERTDTVQSLVHFCSVYKAKVPLSKLVKVIDEDDIDKLVNYRCPACAKCIKCLESNRTKTMSLQESIEQEAIAKSVEIDTVAEKVWVTYPFVKEPIEFLTKYHRGNSDNYYQAHQAYKQQCRKPQKVKEGIRLAHKELVDKGFMKPLSELSSEQQELINNHAFKHYYPWSSVVKDSISTPVRLVVDPSRTGFNQILAKGENNMARIVDVLIRNRCKKHVFTSDISKLYNQLHLRDSALPYSLFLYSDELDPDIPPVIYVLVRAWYGVRSTGNQSGESLESLAHLFLEEFPLALVIILDDRYVDDIFSGCNDTSKRETQIQQVKELLKRGGFKLKYVAKSGEDPPKEAAGEENSLKILGYKWLPKLDVMSPGFSEMNFNKRSRGMRKENETRIDSVEALELALSTTSLTRRLVISKIAEFYDPVGIWEPLKLQLKLEAAMLNCMEWDELLPEELQLEWQCRLKDFLDIPSLEVDRCVIPKGAKDPESVQLLCFSDAAVAAGGAAVYARYELDNGSYSCQLLTAKSKMMDMSIPRNELSAILIMTELAFLVKKALGDMVYEILYFTDSTIAMSWCHNVNKKLRMLVLNRVATIRRFIDWTTGESADIPLFHIPGTENIADLLTKEHKLSPSMLGKESEWIQGKPWMKYKLHDMPIMRYSDLTLSDNEFQQVNTECFLEVDLNKNPDLIAFSNRVQKLSGSFESIEQSSSHFSSVFLARKGPPLIQPLFPIVSVGWKKSVMRMTVMVKFVAWQVHKTHTNIKKHDLQLSLQSKCRVCIHVDGKLQKLNTKLTRDKKDLLVKEFFSKDNNYLGEDYWFRMGSMELKGILSDKKMADFKHLDGIYYYTGRLSREFPVVSSNLDIQIFFDNQDFQAVVPVLHSSSPIFFAYVIHVHDVLRPHSGVELSYREITKKMHVLDNPRGIVGKVRKDCTKCKMLLRKTLELEMANHGPHRTIISPPFHAIQMDIAYKFKAKAWVNSRQSFEIYALVIVCILTSATSILVLEGLETANVVQALERHSSRYGVPRYAFVDAGSQLVALHSAKFSLRDVDLAVHSNLGMSVQVSNPKSHEERGRVEAKVKVLRSMLSKLSVDCSRPMTTISWETLFSKIANDMDNIPICRGAASNMQDFGFDIITPNRLKLGRNNYRSLDDGFVLDSSTETQLLESNRKIQTVWYQIMLDRLHHLIPKCKKWLKTDKIEKGDIVVFVHNDSGIMKRWSWSLGKVDSVTDRNLTLEYFGPGKKRKLYVPRNPRQVAKIHSADDIPVNTVEYYLKNVVHK